MTVAVDLCNRALQLVGSRVKIDAITDDSEEAVNCNITYSSILGWMLGVTNWNFARKTDVLVLTKTATAVGAWTTAQPAPPWRFEYQYPADCIKAIYVMNQATEAATTFNPFTHYAGKPARFVIGTGLVSAAQTRVVLTNEAAAVIVYTMNQVNPDLWSFLFLQAFVENLAWHISFPLRKDQNLTNYLGEKAEGHLNEAIFANEVEGLAIDDKTPEWIQARGITYPSRRPPVESLRGQPQPKDPNDKRR